VELPQPIHTDRHRSSMLHLLSPALAAGMIMLGLAGEPFTLVLGLGFAVYIWLTRQARYEIFHDTLVVRYWSPRRKVLPLTEIKEVQLVKLPWVGVGLAVWSKEGRPIMIRPMDAELFLARLDDARRGLAR